MMVSRAEITVDGRPTFVWTGGAGDPLLLLHGAWAGAEVHWAPVWDRLAEEHRVVAPDFPGLAYDAPWVPPCVDRGELLRRRTRRPRRVAVTCAMSWLGPGRRRPTARDAVGGPRGREAVAVATRR